MVVDRFDKIPPEMALVDYGQGIDLVPDSMVYRHEANGTTIWVGKTRDCDGHILWLCQVESNEVFVGQWEGDDPYEALLNGLIDSVIGIAVDEMWHEPMAQGLKYCCEDVVLAAATYGAQTLVYGYEKLPELFPHTPDGVLTTEDELELYRDLVDAAIGYVRDNADRLGIEFEDIWS